MWAIEDYFWFKSKIVCYLDFQKLVWNRDRRFSKACFSSRNPAIKREFRSPAIPFEGSKIGLLELGPLGWGFFTKCLARGRASGHAASVHLIFFENQVYRRAAACCSSSFANNFKKPQSFGPKERSDWGPKLQGFCRNYKRSCENSTTTNDYRPIERAQSR